MERRRRALGLKKINSNSVEKITNAKPLKEINEPKKCKNKSKLPYVLGADESVERPVNGGKETQNGKGGSVTPKHCTPKRHNSALSNQTDSPGSPLQSPGYQSMFPRTLGSPEIEVSWDWSCSQVSKEVLPPRRTKRKSLSQPAPMSIPAASTFPRHPLCHKQMSEEENQEILTFYKNVLSKSLKGCSDDSSDLRNNNSEKEASLIETTVNTTPKRSLKSSREIEKNQDQINSFFDDSANEFMLECSQAVEEKLRNGEIDMGPIVNIRVESRKHPHSPVLKPENTLKKVCHNGPKHNLFPDSSKNVEKSVNNIICENKALNLRSPQNKLVHTKPCVTIQNNTSSNSEKTECENNNLLFLRPTQQAPVKKLVPNSSTNLISSVANGRINNNENFVYTKNDLLHTGSSGVKDELTSRSVNSSHNESANRRPLLSRQGVVTNNNSVNPVTTNVPALNTNKQVQTVMNVGNYDSVDKFRRVQSGKPSVVDKQSLSKTLSENNSMINKPTPLCNQISRHSTIHEMKNNNSGQENLTNNFDGSKPERADFSHLLDDGLDMELSNLDFDSLCCDSQPMKPQTEPVIKNVPKPTPKLCSQQEIEAKRMAARNKLMMKKKR